ncbi:MAG TPA: integrase arm-type DNA-binding domain-containing protein [Pseudolabrys sp.]|nr:integrase arm-type DNA-binding domain-containing protein [Pseudolabrys sp.]
MRAVRRRHPDRALTAVEVRQIKKPGRHADGNGLYLLVEPSGAKRWVLRIVVRGRRRDIGLGSTKLVFLAAARETAAQYRKTARGGGDPIVEHRKPNVIAPTFKEAARLVHEQHARAWHNTKHREQWINTLSHYAFPYFGDRRVDEVEQADVLRALSAIWLNKPETARRVRQRIRAVFDWAKGAGHRRGDNPVDGVARALPRQSDRAAHHAAMPYADVPAFVRALRAGNIGEPAKLAFELLIITGARTSEVLGARWAEMDLDSAVWTIPADRMKMRREHRVPLAPRAIEIIERAKVLAAGNGFVFAGRSMDKSLSNMALLMVLRRMELDITVHGFRSAFRDWAAEQTNFSREVCEAALAHTIRSKAEAACTVVPTYLRNGAT